MRLLALILFTAASTGCSRSISGDVDLGSEAEWVATGAPGELFGWSVSDVGDVSQDVVSDAAVVAPGSGRVYLFLNPERGATLDSSQAAVTIETNVLQQRIVAVGVGNVTDDPAADLAVGIPSLNGTGSVFVFEGPFEVGQSLTLADAYAELQGEAQGDNAGWAITAGRFRGTENVHDLAVGAPGVEVDGAGDTGAVYWLHWPIPAGVQPLAQAQAKIVWSGNRCSIPQAGREQFGFALTTGDTDGDGVDDIIIGVPGTDPAFLSQVQEPLTPPHCVLDGGQVVVVYGNRNTVGQVDLLGGPPNWRINGLKTRQMVGYSVAAGDIDRDGLDDLVIGAPYDPEYDPAQNPAGPARTHRRGRAYKVLGVATITPAVPHLPPTGDYGLDIDEHCNVLVTGVLDCGRPTINRGQGISLPAAMYRGERDFDRVGISVDARDLEGDGRAEVIIGSMANRVYVQDSNPLFLLFADDVTEVQQLSVVLEGQPGDFAGLSVSGLDGIHGHSGDLKLLIGAPGAAQLTGQSAGRVYIKYGREPIL